MTAARRLPQMREEMLSLVNRIFDAIEDSSGEYFDQHTSPLGKSRHLRLARAGAIPSSKDGRRILMKASDVHAYIAKHVRVPAKDLEEGEVDSVVRLVEQKTRRAG